MPRGESGSSPRKRAAATDLHERLGKDELIKRLKVSEDNFRNDRNAWQAHSPRRTSGLCRRLQGFIVLF